MTHTPETIKLIYMYLAERVKLKEIKKKLSKKKVTNQLIAHYSRKK